MAIFWGMVIDAILAWTSAPAEATVFGGAGILRKSAAGSVAAQAESAAEVSRTRAVRESFMAGNLARLTKIVKARRARGALLYFGVIFFGHLGLGDALAKPLRRDLPRRWVLLGTVAPDLLDKPLYFGLSWAGGHRGLGIVRGTRSFGHAFLLAGLVWWAGRARGDARLKGLALGMATHPVLDFLSDWAAFGAAAARRGSAAFWPLTGWGFPVPTYAGLGEHLRALASPVLLSCEAAGLLWLALSAAAGRGGRPWGRSSTSSGPSGRA